MRKILLPFFTMLLTAGSCFAQDSTAAEVGNVTRISFLDPGISYEKAIGTNRTLYGQAFLQTSAYIGFSDALGTRAGIQFYPSLSLQYRHYYNSAKRAAKGKRTEMNSLNYIAPVIDALILKDEVSWDYSRTRNYHGLYTIGAVWGLQRNYAKHFSLDLSLGLGYYIRNGKSVDVLTGKQYRYTESGITPTSRLSLGFWLNQKK
jgi:hypothetical protein